MADSAVVRVHPLSDLRAGLSGILARFRREGAAAEPVAFGSHRKPEAIILPYQEYEALTRQRDRLLNALDVMRSVQVELPGPFGAEHERLMSSYVDGEIDADEAYRRMLAVYQQGR
jgi:hypothetical protein